MAKCVEDLLVYQKSLSLADDVSGLLKRPSFTSDLKMREQLSASSERVASLIAEGFGLKTDRHFASYLYMARGSSKETRTHLHVGCTRNHITVPERDALSTGYNEVEKMLTGLARYLNRENRRQLG